MPFVPDLVGEHLNQLGGAPFDPGHLSHVAARRRPAQPIPD
jgi:hypothetical protein